MVAALEHHCLHTHLENGIHIFRFRRASRQAVDEWFEYLGYLFDVQKPQSTVRCIMDSREDGIVPLAYSLERARKWLKAHPNIPVVRTAFLQKPDTMTAVLSTAMQMLRTDKVKAAFFEDYNEAVAWVTEVRLYPRMQL